ncbi:MAG: DUF4062 domain-containing protein [Spirochaetota bacterium]|nr:DUF4062 domain-containing protein [Spirochaetota bacterium]
MADKKYQIFISSTYNDLKEERELVMKTILEMYHIPIGMELFSAGNEDQWEIIRDTIDDSDYYILILGFRYGSVTDNGIGYTEKEFDYAQEKKIPILTFIKNENTPLTNDQRENDPDLINKINAFRETAKKNRIVDFWTTAEELAKKITIALTKIFRKIPQIGWIKADKGVSPKVLEEIATLSNERRELEEELRSLRTATNRKPKLGLQILNINNLVLNNSIMKENYIKPIDSNNIPSDLKEFIDENEVKEFNEEIKSKHIEIEEYNQKIYSYNALKYEEQHIVLDILLENSGTIKANNIYADITFPQSVDIYEKDNKPVGISLPKNPIEQLHPFKSAQEKKYYIVGSVETIRRINKDEIVLSHSNVKSPFSQMVNLGSTPVPILPELSKFKMNNLLRYMGIDSKKRTVKINKEKLLHTRVVHYNEEVVIAPLKAGQFAIDVSLFCEEYEAEERLTIPFEIKEI